MGSALSLLTVSRLPQLQIGDVLYVARLGLTSSQVLRRRLEYDGSSTTNATIEGEWHRCGVEID